MAQTKGQSVQQLNSEYKKFKNNEMEIKMWDAYEKQWTHFAESMHQNNNSSLTST